MTGRGSEYEVVIRGRLGPGFATAIEGLEVTSTSADETHLRAWLVDQSALHGMLERIRDLGLELLAVNRVS